MVKHRCQWMGSHPGGRGLACYEEKRQAALASRLPLIAPASSAIMQQAQLLAEEADEYFKPAGTTAARKDMEKKVAVLLCVPVSKVRASRFSPAFLLDAYHNP